MRTLIKLLIVVCSTACHLSDPVKKGSGNAVDTIILKKPTDSLREPEIVKNREEMVNTAGADFDTALLISTSVEILTHIKNGDYRKFATFIHPQDRLRFSPYAYIDTVKDKVLSASEFLQLAMGNKKINWNSSWEEKTELLTVADYFRKFVYDVDFLNAELKSVNQYHSQGTDLNDISEIYPGYGVVEFFFPGCEKKYEGLDFRALRLVYKTKNGKLFLTGIVHDKWNP
jgi:hypothetical protein